MGVKNDVFQSKSERRNYHKLESVWGNDYRIYHNLPFLNVFTPKNLIDWSDWRSPKPFSLTELEFNRLKKTSIDYTLCNQSDKPLVCIEYDGLQEGFNVGTQYFADHMAFGPNPWRQEITELKLKVAHGSFFPFFVVGTDYFNDLTPELKLTIVDGLIGDVLANLAKQERFKQGFTSDEIGFSEEDWSSLDPESQQLYLDDWALEVEVNADMTFNPISRARMDMARQLEVQSWSEEFLVYPEIPPAASLNERARYLENAQKNGQRVTLHTKDYGDVSGTAWISNFKASYYNGNSILEDLAFIAACEKFKKLQTRGQVTGKG